MLTDKRQTTHDSRHTTHDRRQTTNDTQTDEHDGITPPFRLAKKRKCLQEIPSSSFLADKLSFKY